MLVTSNVDDFVRLARAVQVHSGLVLIEQGSLLRDEQMDVVRRALALIEAELAGGEDMVNRVSPDLGGPDVCLRGATMTGDHQLMTLREVADLLNVPNDYVERPPARWPPPIPRRRYGGAGTHRGRVGVQEKRDRERRDGLRELSQMTQDTWWLRL